VIEQLFYPIRLLIFSIHLSFQFIPKRKIIIISCNSCNVHLKKKHLLKAMAGLEPRNPRTRKHCPPDLVLKEEARIPAISSSSLKPTRSFSSSNLQSQHQHIQGQGQGQGQIQGQQHNHQRGGGMASGATQFQPYSPYSPHFPSYRPYTPSAPSTPTTSVFGVAMPMTPSSAVTTFRPEHSSAGQGKADGTNAGSLHPFSKSQRTSSTRRMPSSEASLYDPYRSRQPSVSANRVKNGKPRGGSLGWEGAGEFLF